MARKVELADIEKMNELYYKYKTYAEVARQTGWSAGTVKRYINPNFVPKEKLNIKKFDLDKDLPEFSTEMFEGLDNYGELCVLSDEEKEEMKELWKEMSI